MTDDLIDRLASEVRPVPRMMLPLRLLLGLLVGVVVAALIMVPWIGLRADLATAWMSPIFWVKFGYTLLLAIGGYWALERLSRPGGSGQAAMIMLGVTFVGLAIIGVVQMILMPPEMMPELVFGSTNLVCPLYIVTLSLPIFVVTMWIVRGLAPTNLSLAGFAAGLLSGGAGAWVYAFHCGENGLPFLAIWYTLGVAIVAALGALLGRTLLRW
jgi:hypothetical protein